MLRLAAVLWALGLVTLVPYGTHHLLFEAPREQYALLITLLLFWIFGYWGLVGPIVALVQLRRVMRALEQAHTEGRLDDVLHSRETEDVAVGLIASEHRIPRVLAARAYRLVVERLVAATAGNAADQARPGPTSRSRSRPV